MTTPNKQEKIRAIAATTEGDCFAVAEWEKHIQIWDFNKGLIAKLSTDLVVGMEKAISISKDGQQLAVAGYDKKSVTLYNTSDGAIIWQRKDILKPSCTIILNHYPDQIYIDTEKQGSYLLDRKTGTTLEKIKKTAYIRENLYTPIDQFEKSTTSQLVNRANGKPIKSFNHQSFAMLDAAFSKDKIVCAYSTNPLQAISLTSFVPQWTTTVTGHFLSIEYASELDKILGIRWDYEKGGSKHLSYINIDTGVVEKEINLELPITTAFLKQGSLLLTSQGKLYATVTGKLVKEFDFENT